MGSWRRILFLGPLLRRAGAETQLVDLVNRLPSDDFEKHLLSYRPGDGLKSDIHPSVTLHELERKGRLDFSVGREIGRIIDELEIDAVHCTLQNAVLYGYMGKRCARRVPKLIASIHTTRNANIKLDIADHLVYRPILKRCDQIWFVSTNQARVWARKMPFVAEKAVTIHNGIDPNDFNPDQFETAGQELRAQLGIASEDQVLCCIAGFRPEKMHSVLLDAMARVRSGGRNCHLLLAGTGTTEKAARDQVRALNLEGCVRFLGSLADVRSVLAASDCKILPSSAETFSMAMLEAMAMQVPVIMTSIGGAEEAIDDGVTGMLLRPGNATDLADKIELMLSDASQCKQMGELARQVVIERFSVEKMVAKSARHLV